MRCAVLCILTMAICGPLLVNARKVVVLFPRQTRRSPVLPVRRPFMGPSHFKKSYGNEFHYHGHPNPPYYGRKPSAVDSKGPPFQHGGDDFDQGQDIVNHVHIPYGKGISHALTFGKGYLPYDHIKGSFTFDQERYTDTPTGYKYNDADIASTSFSPSAGALEYGHPTSTTFHASESIHGEPPSSPQQLQHSGDSYFSDAISGDGSASALAMDFQERRNDRKKYIGTRPSDKGSTALSSDNAPLVTSLTQEDNQHNQQLKPQAEFLKQDTVPREYDPQTAVILPSGGIPPTTIGGGKEGIVLRDTVSLEDYHKKVQAFTKNWPSAFNIGLSGVAGAGANAGGGGVVGSGGSDNSATATSLVAAVGPTPTAINDHAFHGQGLLTGSSYPTSSNVLTIGGGGGGGGGYTGAAAWLTDFAQPKQSYEVKEDLMEPPHDFRTMPVQTSPFQGIPINLQLGAASYPSQFVPTY